MTEYSKLAQISQMEYTMSGRERAMKYMRLTWTTMTDAEKRAEPIVLEEHYKELKERVMTPTRQVITCCPACKPTIDELLGVVDAQNLQIQSYQITLGELKEYKTTHEAKASERYSKLYERYMRSLNALDATFLLMRRLVGGEPPMNTAWPASLINHVTDARKAVEYILVREKEFSNES